MAGAASPLVEAFRRADKLGQGRILREDLRRILKILCCSTSSMTEQDVDLVLEATPDDGTGMVPYEDFLATLAGAAAAPPAPAADVLGTYVSVNAEEHFKTKFSWDIVTASACTHRLQLSADGTFSWLREVECAGNCNVDTDTGKWKIVGPGALQLECETRSRDGDFKSQCLSATLSAAGVLNISSEFFFAERLDPSGHPGHLMPVVPMRRE
eukprot:TRINITY_DN18622_c0_g1_i1.p2 TRINITY_DN18622_c0_g1~~TRINITY_DN18622_c0_g1_i1.p2  ORF type:complete len:212 (-),score=46.38 TRINITY_DN18622_c0_g1_i1:25-660(-)